MRHFKQSLVLVLFVFSFSLTAKAQSHGTEKAKNPPATTENLSAQEIAESGSYDGKVYRNEFLKLSITLPEKWTLLSDDVNKAALEAGKDEISKNKSQKGKEEVEKSISNTRVLFQALPFPPGSPDNTAVFACGIEKLQSTNSTVQTYAEQNKKLVLAANEKATLKKDLYSTVLDGVTFSTFEIAVEKEGMSYNQTYIVTYRKGIAFFFVLTFFDNTYKETLANSLKTLTFEK